MKPIEALLGSLTFALCIFMTLGIRAIYEAFWKRERILFFILSIPLSFILLSLAWFAIHELTR